MIKRFFGYRTENSTFPPRWLPIHSLRNAKMSYKLLISVHSWAKATIHMFFRRWSKLPGISDARSKRGLFKTRKGFKQRKHVSRQPSLRPAVKTQFVVVLVNFYCFFCCSPPRFLIQYRGVHLSTYANYNFRPWPVFIGIFNNKQTNSMKASTF